MAEKMNAVKQTASVLDVAVDLDDTVYRQQCAVKTLGFIMDNLTGESTKDETVSEDTSARSLYARMELYIDMLHFVYCGLWSMNAEIDKSVQALFDAGRKAVCSHE